MRSSHRRGPRDRVRGMEVAERRPGGRLLCVRRCARRPRGCRTSTAVVTGAAASACLTPTAVATPAWPLRSAIGSGAVLDGARQPRPVPLEVVIGAPPQPCAGAVATQRMNTCHELRTVQAGLWLASALPVEAGHMESVFLARCWSATDQSRSETRDMSLGCHVRTGVVCIRRQQNTGRRGAGRAGLPGGCCGLGQTSSGRVRSASSRSGLCRRWSSGRATSALWRRRCERWPDLGRWGILGGGGCVRQR